MKKMNADVAVIGAGGMGALFGAILADNGLEVVLIDKNEKHVEAIVSGGLKIEGYDGVQTMKIPATRRFSDLESADLLFFQCKAYGTRDAAKSARCFCREDSVCISFQNGLGNEEIIAEELGSEKVLGGLTTMAGDAAGAGENSRFFPFPNASHRYAVLHWRDAGWTLRAGDRNC